VEIFTGRPYIDRQIDTCQFIRKFDKDIDDVKLIWHKDKRTRIITVIEGKEWKLQLDEFLPITLEKNKQYKIPKETYHRILKGKENLILKIREE
jgi:hypothetical protein